MKDFSHNHVFITFFSLLKLCQSKTDFSLWQKDTRELKMRRFCQHGRRPEVNHAVVDDSRS